MSLYGAPRPKSKPNTIALSSTSIHALSAELALARTARLTSTSSSQLSSSRARPRPSKTKSLFSKSNAGVSERAKRDEYGGKDTRQLGGDVSERDLARSRDKMRVKARLYDAIKRGDVDVDGDGEGLVDFNRKWAEDGGGSGEEDGDGDGDEDEDEDGDGDDGGEMVEYEDEFGRTRVGLKSRVEREKAEAEASARGGEGRTPPEGLIYGNVIQTGAFQTCAFSSVPSSSMLQAAASEGKDQGVQETHYDASKEVRTKGVGFYQFSKDSDERKAEFEELEKERKRTEEERKRMGEKKRRRKEELEKRREEVRRKRRGKVGESWLEGFMGELQESMGNDDQDSK